MVKQVTDAPPQLWKVKGYLLEKDDIATSTDERLKYGQAQMLQNDYFNAGYEKVTVIKQMVLKTG